jgi:hypothetical protein
VTKAKYDAIAAAVIALIQSIFPVLILTGAVDWTSDTIAAVMLVVTNTVTLLGVMLQPLIQTESSNVVKVDFDVSGKTNLDKAA